MDEEKLSKLIVDKMFDRAGNILINTSLMMGVVSISLFLYGKYYSIEKGLKKNSE
jgi:uncharacterized membrane protein